jgi:multimeric flavodoxin WrbA
MHILGIANGTPNGNSEVLLKASLLAAQSASPSTTISWFHAPSVETTSTTVAKGSLDISAGANKALSSHSATGPIEDNDINAVREALLNADAWVFATPVYSHMPHGPLKALFDKFGGPFMDASFAKRVRDSQAAGEKTFAHLNIDERLLKPRVVGFIASGGSDSPDQVSLALPGLHLLVYAMHAKVVDQVALLGLGATGVAALVDDGKPLRRAELLGRVSISCS